MERLFRVAVPSPLGHTKSELAFGVLFFVHLFQAADSTGRWRTNGPASMSKSS